VEETIITIAIHWNLQRFPQRCSITYCVVL